MKRTELEATSGFGAGIVELDSGDLLVCGTGATNGPTETDALFMRLDPTGKALWAEVLGDPAGRERIEGMCRLETGVVGPTKSIAGGSQGVLVLFVDPAALP
ncbi:MAG: hypothetical protein ABFD77_08730 [Thermotogota bacterium]